MRTVLLVGGDLSAKARLEAAAAVAKMELRLATFGGMTAALSASKPAVLVLDLDEGREGVLAELMAAGAEGLTPDLVFGYFSHVDEDLGEAARAAGCEPVPRGRFWRTLPDILSEASRSSGR